MSKSKLRESISRISREALYQYYIKQNHSKKDTCKHFEIAENSFNNLCQFYEIKKDLSTQIAKRKQTCLEKYGVDNPSKNIKVIDKIRDSKSGIDEKAAYVKRKQTKLQKYGDEKYNNIDKAQRTKTEKYGSSKYNNREKAKETCLSKFGEDNFSKTQTFKEARKEQFILENSYSDIFKNIFYDEEAAKEFLGDKKYSYFDLVKLFNAPYYVIQMWATKHNLRDRLDLSSNPASHYEDEIVEYLNSIGISNIIKNDRKILACNEIDIYLPDLQIGIEFNGNYWHSDLWKDKKYHFNKSKLAQDKGIRLIHIYQYEWDDERTRSKIKSLLRIACGKVNNKIYARNCEIRKISNKEAKPFNDLNHLQNHRNALITYGLFYENRLVQLMSFSHHKKYEWEIIRGCPGSNNIVVGGVSKLFKHFIRENNPQQIFSYCDFNKFDGIGYESIGMKFIGYTAPDKTWLIKGVAQKRSASHYQEYKKEADAIIWGAGSKKYLWSKN